MGIDHGGAHIFMAQKLLHGADVVTLFQKVGGEAVTKGVAADVLVHTCKICHCFDGSLQTVWMNVISSGLATPWIPGQTLGRKNILPSPLSISIGVLALKPVGEENTAVSPLQGLSRVKL